MIEALIRMTTARDISPGALRSLAVRLYGIWRMDDNPRVRGCVGRVIGSIYDALSNLGYTNFLQGNETVTLEQLAEAKNSGSENPDDFLNRMVLGYCEKLAKWAKPCAGAESNKCRLAEAV